MRACCAQAENLRVDPPDPKQPDRLVRVCLVCGARHIEVSVDPLRLGMRLQP